MIDKNDFCIAVQRWFRKLNFELPCFLFSVEYLTNPNVVTIGVPVYQLASVVRECATSEVETQCTPNDVAGSNLQFVTCQETCQGDGCNTGWRKCMK